MSNARNWYLYIANAISLHGVAWALIVLLRIILLGDVLDKSSLALQLSIIIIGLPVYLIHWLWAQRLARAEAEERTSIQRQLFLFGTLAGTLGPVINNIFQLLNQGIVLGNQDALVYNLIPLLVLAIILIFHYLILKEDMPSLEQEDPYLVLRQIFILGFSFTGLVMLFLGSVNLLSIIIDLGKSGVSGSIAFTMGTEICRLFLGAVVWGIFWSWSQGMSKTAPDEQTATFRWTYLYLLVVISTIGTITALSLLVETYLRTLLGLESTGQRSSIYPVLIMMAVFWAYHTFVIRSIVAQSGMRENLEKIRWAYHYIVSLVGFVAFIIGLTGLLHIFIRVIPIGEEFTISLKGDLSIFLAMLLAGLPTWILAWRVILSRIKGENSIGERDYAVRKFYLYSLVLGATITLMHGLIYVIYQMLLRLLGQASGPSFLQDTAVYLANIIVAILVLAYFWSVLRADNQLIKMQSVAQFSELKGVILEGLEEAGRSILKAMQDAFPGMQLGLIDLSLGVDQLDERLGDLAQADLIVVPMSILSNKDSYHPQIFQAVFASPAKKVLIPQDMQGFEWVSVRILESKNLQKKTVKTIQRILAGETNISERPLGCLSIAGIIVGGIILLLLLTSLVSAVL